jgi:hypothetical protein
MRRRPQGRLSDDGGGGGTRTRDLRFSKPTLSRLVTAPLSYTPVRLRVSMPTHDGRSVSPGRRGDPAFTAYLIPTRKYNELTLPLGKTPGIDSLSPLSPDVGTKGRI